MTSKTAAAARKSIQPLAGRSVALAAASLLALVTFAGCSDGGGATTPSRTGLFVSDFHFNPLLDPVLADRLVEAPPSQWDAIFASSTKDGYSQAGADTNFPLLQSALAAMKARTPSPDIVFISGDLLAHELNVFFDGAVTNPTPAGLAAFTYATEQYLALKLTQTFPAAQIVPTMGDWDSDAAVAAFPSPAFIASFAASWTASVNRNGGAPDLQATFPTGGYYSTAFPIDPRGRLIVLYTQPWAAECANGCGTGPGSPGAVELAWLTAQLADARSRGQRVWLLGHIPPGMGAPGTAANTVSGVACAAAAVPYYLDAYAVQLQALYRQYQDVLALGIFAHEHSDDYRLLRDASGLPILGMKLIPSITPVHPNNPAFVHFAYDPASGTITEATTVALFNLPVATTEIPGIWAPEYSFTQAYGQVAFDSRGLAGAVDKIQTTAAGQALFTTYMTSSNPAGNPPGDFSPFLAYRCAFDRLTVADFNACYCGP
jgi:sphingomyelin phosphodiesterase acid-like 3